MWHFSDYVARVQPQVAIMESVQVAFTAGRELMQALRRNAEEKSGRRYELIHVMQNAIELGGAAKRPRYFMVLSQVPFGVEYPDVRRPTMRDIIGDLEDLPLTWQMQDYATGPTWWSADKRSSWEQVDGHQVSNAPVIRRGLDLQQAMGLIDPDFRDWPPGWNTPRLMREFDRRHGYLPHTWFQDRIEHFRGKDYFAGFAPLVRWKPDEPARVVHGAALQSVIHPWLPRTLTYREVARVMGFPDSWLISPLAPSGAPATWGKGITCQCGKWIGDWTRQSLLGEPGALNGVEIGDRERFIQTPRRPLRKDLQEYVRPATLDLQDMSAVS